MHLDRSQYNDRFEIWMNSLGIWIIVAQCEAYYYCNLSLILVNIIDQGMYTADYMSSGQHHDCTIRYNAVHS